MVRFKLQTCYLECLQCHHLSSWVKPKDLLLTAPATLFIQWRKKLGWWWWKGLMLISLKAHKQSCGPPCVRPKCCRILSNPARDLTLLSPPKKIPRIYDAGDWFWRRESLPYSIPIRPYNLLYTPYNIVFILCLTFILSDTVLYATSAYWLTTVTPNVTLPLYKQLWLAYTAIHQRPI